MSYTNEAGRRQILDDSGEAEQSLGFALAALGDAYEHLDDQSAERMEDLLFRPAQSAFGLLKRTRTEFAARYGLDAGELMPAPAGLPADPRAMLERTADAVASADELLAELQDSLLPVEVGDQPLREGLSRVRSLIAPVPAACGEFVRTIGR
jgi:hypothetical protein